ncbi:MAG: TonB-dependent receptor [Acidobacteriota bacterium]
MHRENLERAALAALFGFAVVSPLFSEEPDEAASGKPKVNQEIPAIEEEVEVRERSDRMVGFAVSASEGSTGTLDLSRRPILRPGDVVETVPEMVATQHSGGGKANQFFVRGFNLDHGTDFAFSVDGVPVNMPTHGHGQGYADLNFLIPEIVGRARFRKGPYWAEIGDFSSAGGVDIDLVDRLPSRLVQLTGGSFDFGRALFAESFSLGTGPDPGNLLVALEGFHDDGPWTTRGDDYDGGKAVVRWSQGDSRRSFSVTAMGYDANWLSTDQVPRRAVDSGLIGRFDLLDDGPRGENTRFSLSANGQRTKGNAVDRVSLWALANDFTLVSNFTYFLGDEDGGDEFTQLDDRASFGGDLSRTWYLNAGSRGLQVSTGLDFRYDAIDNGLLFSQDAVPTSAIREDSIDQWGGGLYVQLETKLTDWMRVTAGLRGHFYDADVTSSLNLNSGTVSDELLLPKLSVALGPWSDTELYLNYGLGMHSNDARGTVIAVDPLTREIADLSPPLVESEGFDIGVRTVAIPGLQSTLTLFRLDLDSELVFVGDAGATEAGRPSRREGVEWTNHYVRGSWIGDLDVTLTDGEFTDADPSGNEIPGAVGTTIAAGIAWENDRSRWGAGLRWRYFGDVPLIEDGSQEWDSSQLLNGRLSYRLSERLELQLDVFNLLDREQSDIEYFYASRLPGEPVDGIEDVHFHPTIRRSGRLTLRWRP